MIFLLLKFLSLLFNFYNFVLNSKVIGETKIVIVNFWWLNWVDSRCCILTFLNNHLSSNSNVLDWRLRYFKTIISLSLFIWCLLWIQILYFLTLGTNFQKFIGLLLHLNWSWTRTFENIIRNRLFFLFEVIINHEVSRNEEWFNIEWSIFICW